MESPTRLDTVLGVVLFASPCLSRKLPSPGGSGRLLIHISSVTSALTGPSNAMANCVKFWCKKPKEIHLL